MLPPAVSILPETHADSAMLESQGMLQEHVNTGMPLAIPLVVGRRQFFATIDTDPQVTITNDALANEFGMSLTDAGVVALSGAKSGRKIES
jgi:hypothetical protein